MAAADESDKKIKGNIGDILIEYGSVVVVLIFHTFLKFHFI